MKAYQFNMHNAMQNVRKHILCFDLTSILAGLSEGLSSSQAEAAGFDIR